MFSSCFISFLPFSTLYSFPLLCPSFYLFCPVSLFSSLSLSFSPPPSMFLFLILCLSLFCSPSPILSFFRFSLAAVCVSHTLFAARADDALVKDLSALNSVRFLISSLLLKKRENTTVFATRELEAGKVCVYRLVVRKASV